MTDPPLDGGVPVVVIGWTETAAVAFRMNDNIPMRRSGKFNEAFDGFENAFLKALAYPNPFVFEIHEAVLPAIRGMAEENAIAKLREAERRFLDHAAGHRFIRSADDNYLDMSAEQKAAELMQDAQDRHNRSTATRSGQSVLYSGPPRGGD